MRQTIPHNANSNMFKFNKDKREKRDTPCPIGEVVNDYFLRGETPLAIAYRQHHGQEVCETVINFKINHYANK